MIKRLHIENYLLIENLDIEFDKGLNIITGETGAGKSILLGAIAMLMGAKADPKAAKVEGKSCKVEAIFDIARYNLKPLFDKFDIEYDDQTTISRVIAPSGKSRAFINDLPVTLSDLRAISEQLLDIHSQHQTLLLAHENFQIDIIDSVAKNSSIREAYQSIYSDYKALRNRLEKLEEEYRKNLQDFDFIKFQYDEISGVNISDGELKELEERYATLSNAAQIKEVFNTTCERLDGEDDSIISTIKSLSQSFEKISDYSTLASTISERLNDILYELKDINQDSYSFIDSIDDDPGLLDQIESRMSRINSLLFKYNLNSDKELIDMQNNLEERLLSINLGSSQLDSIKADLESKNIELLKQADLLTKSRIAVASTIENYVIDQLKDLGMEHSRFEISIEESDTMAISGRDRVKFKFSANKGLDLQPIEKVASGGEMSRIMLSLKSLSATHKQLPSIIFDEIDTGVSGRVADKMGEIMSRLSESLQTICITHLPQMASKGSAHFVVRKEQTNDSTTTIISKLDHKARVEEVAKMISGSHISKSALDQAKLLLKSN